MKNFTSMKFVVVALFLAIGTKAMAETIDWVASAQGYANQTDIASIDFDDVVSATLDKGDNKNGPKYYNTGSAIRLYGGNSMTITAKEATLTEIKFVFASGEGSNAINVDNGDFQTDSWEGSSSTVTFTIDGTSGHRRIASLQITYTKGGDVVTVHRPVITPASGTYTEAQTVTITADDGLDIYYAINKAGYVKYTEPFEVKETTIITAYAQDANGNKSSEATSEIKIVDLSDIVGKGTAEDPYNVASAIKLLAAGQAPKEATFVSGVISRIGIEKDGQLTDLPGNSYGNATYFIKDKDGSDELEIYRGFGLGGLKFTSEDDIKVGDEVIIEGNLKLFGTTPEMDQGNKIYSLNGQLPKPEVTYETIAAIKAAAKAEEVLVAFKLNSFLVTYVSGSNIYITDGKEGFLLYGTTTAKVGDKIDGTVTGKLYLYHGLPELSLMDVENLSVVSSDNDVVATEIEELGDLDTPAEALAYTSMIVKISGFNAGAEALTDRAVTINQNGDEVTVYDQFNLLSTTQFSTTREYTATFIVSVRDETVQLYPLDKSEWEAPYTLVGDGTKENPYTVADVQHFDVSNKDFKSDLVWVKGYIVGVGNGNISKYWPGVEGVECMNTNILLADAANETSSIKFVPVNLVNKTVYREKLNLVDNPDNLGKVILIQGKIQAYFSVPGVKDLADAVIDGIALGISEVNTESVRAQGIFTLAGQRVNTITRGGMYIIGGKKVLVK